MDTFHSSRYFAASMAQVFAAIRDPQRLARWWGPEGFSNRFEVFDFQPGGRWVFDMIGPDGTVYRNESGFAGIEADRQVVVRHVSQPQFTLTITLAPREGGTQVDWQQVFDDPAVAQAVAAIVRPANEQNLDRLGRELGLNTP